MIIYRAVTFPLPHIFSTASHPDNTCIADSQKIDALCFSVVPFIEINFLDLSSEANETSFCQFIF